MAKRGKSVRRRPIGRKVPAARKRASADVDIHKENAVLRRELAEALDRQAATSEVLSVIGSTPGELGPVFQSMVAGLGLSMIGRRKAPAGCKVTASCVPPNARPRGDGLVAMDVSSRAAQPCAGRQNNARRRRET
jgi:hypothetical protein